MDKQQTQYQLARRMGSPRQGWNRRRRTREGPELACVQTPLWFGLAHAGREGWINILPWYRPVGRGKTSSETQRRKSRAARKGKWPPRGTGTTLLTYPGSAPWRTGKAGENGQHSGEVGGSSAWTRPSDLGWGSSSKTAPGSLSTGSPAGRTPPHGDGSMYSQANVRVESVLRPPTRALPSVIVNTEKVLREAGWAHRSARSRSQQCVVGGEVFSPGCASRTGRWEPGGARRTHRHQKPTRRHPNQRKFHTWWVESFVELV